MPSLVFLEEHNCLLDVSSMNDIHNKVFDMDQNSAIGLDNFSGLLCQKAWKVIGSNIIEAMGYFLSLVLFN